MNAAQAALKWALANKNIDTTVPGMTTFEHLAQDLSVLMDYFGTFLDWTCEKGSTLIRSQAWEMRRWERQKQEALLLSYWRGEEIPGGNFFPKAFLQPYASFLAAHGKALRDRPTEDGACPFCGGAPQMSYLQSPPSIVGGGAEGARRYLLCSLCFTTWPVNRISCAHCQEVDPYKLPYYQTDQLPTVRVEACDTCKHYIKGVDLTKDGLAVPLVDEIATPALDLWAQEHGYQKVELNLAGI
ncbi:MAG: formate dehydrogenase accessory protein FdhE [Deltaproteobacteria bacterium]|nr:formate dehydrogenase accessory protein FdhE [Deltaproteobacteria bacterium]